MKYVILILLAWGLLIACSDEDTIIPRDADVVLRYEFPQGTNEWDEIAEEIKEKHDVYLIYKGFTSLDFSRAWTIYDGTNYFGEALTDEKAKNHVKYMKEHIFAYLPVELTRAVLPQYYFLIDNYRTETASSYSTSILKADITNFSGGLDFWASSIYRESVTEFPSTPEALKEHRVRIMKLFFEAAIGRGRIVIPSSFHDGFDYTTAISSWDSQDPNYYLTRGFLGSLSTDSYNLGSIYNIKDMNQNLNFLTYVFIGMRYSEEDFLAKYPTTYTLIHKKRLEVINYMKEKYHVDLEAICQGPVL